MWHRWRGEVNGSTTTATYRGLAAGYAIEQVLLFDADPLAAAVEGLRQAKVGCESEGRPLTDEADRQTSDIAAEIAVAIGRIGEVMGHIGGEVVGLELPCRMTLELDGTPIPFASHIDCLIRHEWGHSIVDWKWRMDAPTQAGMDRDLQLGIYRLMADRGHFLIGGAWKSLAGRAKVGIVHLPYLKPVGRKTSFVDLETGEVIELVKGDARPIHKAVRWANHRHTGSIVAALEERVRMIRAGIWPALPDMIGCMTCESEPWCSRFDRQTAWETKEHGQ